MHSIAIILVVPCLTGSVTSSAINVILYALLVIAMAAIVVDACADTPRAER